MEGDTMAFLAIALRYELQQRLDAEKNEDRKKLFNKKLTEAFLSGDKVVTLIGQHEYIGWHLHGQDILENDSRWQDVGEEYIQMMKQHLIAEGFFVKKRKQKDMILYDVTLTKD